jgi:hypothetical protein
MGMLAPTDIDSLIIARLLGDIFIITNQAFLTPATPSRS